MLRTRLALACATVALAAPAFGAPAPAPAPLHDLLRHSTFTPPDLDPRVDVWRAAPIAPADTAATALPQLRADTGPFSLHGDVLVMIGDAQTVSSLGNNRWGVRVDDEVQNPLAIVRTFLDYFPDDYDVLTVWTSFRDRGSDGLAYYMGMYNDVGGIGVEPFNNRRFWGVNNAGRMQGFVNMKRITSYSDDLADPDNFIYSVMGQELTHRWLAHLRFLREDGTVSSELLGRDDAHWSALMQASGSVQDGNTWRDNGDGTFTLTENSVRFSPLDLYAMGLFTPEEVPPWFLIEGADYEGNAIAPTSVLPVGITVTGSRYDVGIDDVLAAEGPRLPGVDTSPKDLRVAVVLLTAPNETLDDVAHLIPRVQRFIDNWTVVYRDWTDGRGSVCHRVNADCAEAVLALNDFHVREVVGDGDDMPEPGETVAIDLVISNPGGAIATSPRVHLALDALSTSTVTQTPVFFPELAPGTATTLEAAFTLTLGPDVACGEDLVLPIEMATGGALTELDIRFPVGFDYRFSDDFETDMGWVVDPDGADTATAGMWERAVPEGVTYGFSNRRLQPSGGVGASPMCFVTGAASSDDGPGAFDVDDGRTTLLSPSVDLAEAVDPVLTYATWHAAGIIGDGPFRLDDNDPLTVELSPDEGQTWLLLDEDLTFTQVWNHHEVRLLDVLPELPPTVRLRFTAVDNDPQSISEAGVDEVRLYDLQPTCFGTPWTPPDPTDPIDPVDPVDPVDPTDPTDPNPAVKGATGGGCATGPVAPTGLALLIGLGLLLAILRRARAL